MNSLIERLEEYRLEHRISQEKLAETLGVAFITVNRWLNGHTEPNKIQTYHIKKLLAAKGERT
jgi:transcriptional regulator with XRE-family HTH domain